MEKKTPPFVQENGVRYREFESERYVIIAGCPHQPDPILLYEEQFFFHESTDTYIKTFSFGLCCFTSE